MVLRLRVINVQIYIHVRQGPMPYMSFTFDPKILELRATTALLGRKYSGLQGKINYYGSLLGQIETFDFCIPYLALE